jgi:ABC-type molybdenum transport system ATPase subunit/photorepair protein PhrA
MLLQALIIIGTLIGLYFLIQRAYNVSHMKTLYIIRGLPGSGKSTLASVMATQMGIQYHETDQYLYNDAGDYEWSEERLGRAIDLCYDAVYADVKTGKDTISVGVYTRWRAMRDTVELGQTNGYQVKIITCLGDFGSIHGAPVATLARMKDRFIPNVGLPRMQGIIYSEHLPAAEFAANVA